ncbi:MAG: protein translocase subunit SecD [Rickettsiales bacterium]|jgi:protein-export membrane protein SecD|nr:protein translocase subunit SecD [Rickettsiales bacterium]
MGQSKTKALFISFVIIASVALCLPTFLPQKYKERLPPWLRDQEIALGLDLKGGAYILLEADLDNAVREKTSALRDLLRRELRGDRAAGKKAIPYSNIATSGNFASAILKSPDDAAEIRRRIAAATAGEAAFESDGSRIRVSYPQAAIDKTKADIMASSVEIVRRRVDSLGNKEPSIARQGDSRIMVQIPGADDPERVKDLVGKTAKMTFHLVDEDAMRGGVLGADSEVVDGYAIKRSASIPGDLLTDSRADFSQQDGRPVVTTSFNPAGAREFSKMTSENVGKRFAIVLDGKVLSAPVIQEPITGGSGQISGGFSIQEARDLSTMLRSGALPAEMSVVEERTVGAGLGSDSIAAGTFASAAGGIFVLVFLFLTYGLMGIFADLALVLNITMIFAGLALTGATLTLPGIAGIALNIGMSVDASILIFERMREERRLGLSPAKSIDNGFDNAFSAIIDSNLTTLACGLIMLNFGSGPVKGFAITLIIGIISSLFTNITFLRFILDAWARKARKT